MAWKFIDNIKESIKADESPEVSRRFEKTESFFARTIGGSGLSWGLVLLAVFGIYAVVNLIIIILKVF